MSENIENCPNCQNSLEVNEGYITWCDKCYWNINPDIDYLSKKRIFDFAYENISKVSVNNLYNEVLQAKNIKQRISAYSILAYVISAFIYAISIFFMFFSLRVLFFSGGAPHTYLLSIIFLIFGIEIFPRVTKVRETKLDPQEYPGLFKLVDTISNRIKGQRINNICVSYDYNAYFTTSGLKRENVIILGIPYFSILDINEKISVIAHELTHCSNKDTSRHSFVFTAVTSLSKWYSFLLYFGEIKILLPISWPLSLIVKMFIYILGIMVWRDRQRAEYYADYTAAKIAGVEATISSSEKFYYHPSFFNILKRTAERTNANDLFDNFRKHIKNVPEREIKRVKTLEQLETCDLQSSHPPTLYRNQYISSKIKDFDKLELSQEEINQIENEFKRLEDMIQRRLLSDYREFYVYR